LIRIKKIHQFDEKTLEIHWLDGKQSRYNVIELRRRCSCAKCRNEWTGEQTLRAEDVSENVRPSTIDSVGCYALRICFNDGHDTGIYSFQQLYSMS